MLVGCLGLEIAKSVSFDAIVITGGIARVIETVARLAANVFWHARKN